MKSSENKFMSRLSNDIVTENHHLKTEVIRIKKVLNNYQQLMVDQFLKLSKQLNLDKKGFIFETPQQYLNYFIQIVNQNFTMNHQLEQSAKKTENQNIKLKQNMIIKSKMLDEETQNNYKKEKIIKQLETNKQELQKKTQQLQKRSKIKQIQLKQQIVQLKQEIVRIQKESNIKLLQEKKSILEKTNKQMAKYRAQMDSQLHKKQKSLKNQSDKRDRQMKSLITTIQALTQRKQSGEGKFRQRNGTVAMKSLAMLIPKTQSQQQNPIINITPLSDGTANQPQQSPIDILKSVIKPFTEHANLQQKISELRKENINFKNQIRQNNTNIINLQAALTQKTNQYQLILSKYESMKTQFQKKRQQLIQTTQQLIKSKQDKQAMEKYYDQRWNSEMNNVKYHLQKKLAEKIAKLDEQHNKLKQQLIQQKQNVRLGIIEIREESEKIKKWNQNLISQVTVIGLQKQILKQAKQQVQRRLYQNQCMHEQDVLSLHHHYHYFNIQLKNKIVQQQATIKYLNNKIKELNDQLKLSLIKLRKDIQKQNDKKIDEIHHKNLKIIQQKNETITKLSLQIASHKIVIQGMQRQESQKMEIMRQKINKQKQKQTRDMKVAHFEQISKLNDKIIKTEERINDMKNKLTQKQLKFDIFQQQVQTLIKEKQKTINQFQLIAKANNIQIQRLNKVCEQHQLNVKTIQQHIQSIIVQLNSKNLIMSQKDEQIKRLIKQKDNWINDLKCCKRQYEKGFKDLRQIHERKVSFYKSRIWELQRIAESGGISKKDYEKIRSLTEEKKKLQDQVVMKQAENLVLNQVKNYYENKSKQQDSRMTTKYELKDQRHPVFVRRPKRNMEKIKQIKTQISEDLNGFTGMQACEVKRIMNNSSQNKNKSTAKFEGTEYSQFRSNSRSLSRAKARINSSLM